MKYTMQRVREFHERHGQHIGNPATPDVSRDSKLRTDLIGEELGELKLALDGYDKHGAPLNEHAQVVAAADALGDLVYVIAGAAVTWGIPLAEVFDAIHRSNMTKSVTDKRADGKVMKGPDYVPPDIAGALILGVSRAKALPYTSQRACTRNAS